MKKRKTIKTGGITLIALVITIIALLILAGVTIITLTGENGILRKATEAQVQTIIEQEKEEVKLAYNSVFTNKLKADVTSKELQQELDKMVGVGKTEVTPVYVF